MFEFRCGSCDKKLAETDGNTNIVCTRCGSMNKLNINSKKNIVTPKKKREPLRQTSSGKRFY